MGERRGIIWRRGGGQGSTGEGVWEQGSTGGMYLGGKLTVGTEGGGRSCRVSKGSSLSSLAVESRQGDCRSGEGGPSSFSGLGRAGVFCALLHLSPVGPA